MSKQHSSYDSIFVVFDKQKSGTHRHLGTAFTMGGGVFGTAAHVAELVESANKPSLVRRNANGSVTAISITAAEPFPAVDFGLLQADYESVLAPWAGSFLPERLDVWTEGFGFGYDVTREKIITRFMKGHIVSRQMYENWSQTDPTRTGLDDYEFGVYELSFMIPSGQSGSPLFYNDHNQNSTLIGIVVGNSKASLGTIDKTEIVSEDEKVERVEYYNYLHLGSAISTHCLLTLESNIIGSSIVKHLGGKVADLPF